VELPCFMDDFEACIAHLRFPVTHRRAIQTTNLLERLYVEWRRRLKIIPNAFGERAVLKLMFGALIRAAERRRSVKVTEFERRQMASVQKELDQEYAAMVGLNVKPPKDEIQVSENPAVLGLDRSRSLSPISPIAAYRGHKDGGR
jgi:putative transposase